ncbi:MAG: ankyrin repeat domain-containing protein [Sulfurimonas sp.]|jgi:ankyrin repeat protein|nr:ankyrin repeat domain-containing protein [Sulfurimonadaceae bacterium]
MNRWLELLKNNDYIGVKKYILDGGDVNDSSDNGESVLAYALRYKCDKELIDLLVESGADVFDFDEHGVSIFEMAITYDYLEFIKELVAKGVDVNATKRKSRFTPLMCAVCYGRVDVAKYLIECGADIKAIDQKGISVVDFARKLNKKSMLEMLEYDENAPKNTSYAR